TRYVPLTIQPDDTCTIPRIRPHKIPRIYPLVACPVLTSDCCYLEQPDYEASTVQPISPSNDWTTGSRRWQVIRVSRSDRNHDDSHVASHLIEKRLLRDDHVRCLDDEDGKSMRLLVMGPGQKKQSEEPRQSRRKLSRISQKKFRPCDYICPMAKIPEHKEISFSAKPKQVRFDDTSMPTMGRNK
ncbi:hypothetical protein V3C99_005894, partial [Haemonchus contortus]